MFFLKKNIKNINNKIQSTEIKKIYQKGTKIKTIYIATTTGVDAGAIGIVDHVDEDGYIWILWEDNCYSKLVYGIDKFLVLDFKANCEVNNGNQG